MLQNTPAPQARLSFLNMYGFVGLALAASVHLGSYVGRSLASDHPLFWGLHVGIFPLFFIFVIRVQRWSVRRRGLFGLPTAALRWRELLGYCPPWVAPVLSVLFVYVMGNFFFATGHIPSAATVSSGGTSAADMALYTTRAFSGHWLIFYAVPTLFFTYVPPDVRPVENVDDAAA
jgi:hypothetical protein